MSELPPPPPRRPAPEHLRDEIARTLAGAQERRSRWRTALLPVAAATLVGATIFGVSALSGRQAVVPSDTASPYPATATPTPPTATASSLKPPSPSPSPPAQLNVRPMTKTEIAADTKSCRRQDGSDDDTPRRGTPRAKYAMVQVAAGVRQPLAGSVRLLLLQDAAGSWVCENGANTSWTAGDLATEQPTKAVTVWEVANYGGFRANCGDQPKVSGAELFVVGNGVAVSRMRLVAGGHPGAWQTADPAAGLVHFFFGLAGPDAQSGAVSAEFEFLDRRGRVLTIQPYGERGTLTAKKLQQPVSTCAEVKSRIEPPEAIRRPKTDQAGITTCLKMGKEWAEEQELPFRSRDYKARLVVSSDTEWGAVISNGRHRFGCSLFPTKEISRLVPDNDAISEPVFAFALNPIPAADGESLWASGRVPQDVTSIHYRLPGHRDVAAKIDSDGYWMLKYHEMSASLAEGNVARWPAVVVTLTRASGRTQTIAVKFNESTMCNQVSHGC